VLVTLAVLLANAPTWLHLVQTDPLALTAGLNNVGSGILPGQPFADPNVGYTLQALGKQAAMQLFGGHLPWWNPYEGVGMPLTAEMQSGAFFPGTLILSSIFGVTGLLMVLECCTGYATYFLLRRLRIGLVASTAGAIAFSLCGAAAWVTNAPVRPIFALPLCLLGVERCLDGEAPLRRGRWALLAAGFALSILAGFPETAAIDAGFVALWAWCRMERRERSVFAAQTRALIIGIVVGVVAAAPVVLAFITYFPSAWVGPHASQFAHLSLPTEGLVQLFFPYGLGPINGVRLPAGQLWGGVGGYLQATVVAGAVLGLFGRQHRGLRVGLGVWVAVMVARAFGFSPLVLLFGAIPGLKMIVLARYCVPSVELAMVALCCLGLNDLGRLRVTKQHLQRSAVIVGLIALLATLGSWWVLSGSTTLHRTRRHPAGLSHPASHAATVWSVVLATLVLGALAVGIWLQVATVEPQSTQRIRRNGGRLLVALSIVVESIVLFGLPQLSAPSEAHVDLKPVMFLRSHLGTQRFFTLGPLQANYGSAFSISQVNVNDLPQPENWVHFVERYLDTNVTPVSFTALARAHLHGPTPAEELNRNLANYEAIGVKYIVVTPRAKDVLGIDFPVHHGPEWPNGPRLVFADRTAKIYELPHSALIFSIRRVAGEHGTKACSATITSSAETTTICDSAIQLTRRVLSMPEWKATIDGKPVAIQPSQGLTKSIFQQVTVPAGTHKVVFHYDPPFGGLSVVVALLAWVLIIGLLLSTSSARRVLTQRFGRRGVEPVEVPEEAETSVAIPSESSPEGEEDAQTGDALADR
jgi:hypothetical protein